MMNKMLLVPIVAALALAGCKKDAAPAGEGKSIAEVAKETAGMPKPQPGKYRTTMTMLSLDVPGMPLEAAAQMKKGFAQHQTGTEYCLTGEEAAKGYEENVKKLAARPDCAFDHYSADGGMVNAQLTCKTPDGGKSVMTMQGAMSPTGSDMTMSMDQSGPQMPGGAMKVKMNVKSERIGECS